MDGWLRMKKIDRDYKQQIKSEKFRLHFSRCTNYDVHVAPLVKILKSTLINISRKVQENDLKLICLRHKVSIDV